MREPTLPAEGPNPFSGRRVVRPENLRSCCAQRMSLTSSSFRCAITAEASRTDAGSTGSALGTTLTVGLVLQVFGASFGSPLRDQLARQAAACSQAGEYAACAVDRRLPSLHHELGRGLLGGRGLLSRGSFEWGFERVCHAPSIARRTPPIDRPAGPSPRAVKGSQAKFPLRSGLQGVAVGWVGFCSPRRPLLLAAAPIFLPAGRSSDRPPACSYPCLITRKKAYR